MNIKLLVGTAALTLAMTLPSAAVADNPPTLPTVPVQGTGYSGVTVICTGMECAGLWDMGPQFDMNLDDAILIGVEVSVTPAKKVPDSKFTKWMANCDSDLDDRRSHANEDLRHYQIARRAAGLGPVSGNVRVTYDDGGTEVWPMIGPQASVVALAPVSGSLKCP